MSIVMCLSRGVCVATLPSEVAADRSVGFVRFWLYITLNSELCLPPDHSIVPRAGTVISPTWDLNSEEMLLRTRT